MRELSAAEIDEVLLQNGIGTLALNDGNTPYPIPMSYGYDGEKPLFVMQFGDGGDSQKIACLETSQTAGFLVYDQTGEGLDTEWRSVVIRGTLKEVEEAASMDGFSALASSAEFAPDMTIWGAALEDTELTLYELKVEERSGRAFTMGQ